MVRICNNAEGRQLLQEGNQLKLAYSAARLLILSTVAAA